MKNPSGNHKITFVVIRAMQPLTENELWLTNNNNKISSVHFEFIFIYEWELANNLPPIFASKMLKRTQIQLNAIHDQHSMQLINRPIIMLANVNGSSMSLVVALIASSAESTFQPSSKQNWRKY